MKNCKNHQALELCPQIPLPPAGMGFVVRLPPFEPAATLRVAIDFRLIATQVIFDPEWTIIQSGLLYLNISYPNFNFFDHSLEKGFHTLQLNFFDLTKD